MTITIKIERCAGQFVTRLPGTMEPVGIDLSEDLAIWTAVRGAIRLSREHHRPVVIETEQPDGRFKRGQIVNPHFRQKPKPRGLLASVATMCVIVGMMLRQGGEA
jgi:hypothetical protein